MIYINDNNEVTSAIIDYFKLVLFMKVCKDSNSSVFGILGGEELCSKVIEYGDKGEVDLEKTNLELLKELLEEIRSIKRINSTYLNTSALKKFDWLNEAIKDINPNETGIETIILKTYYGTEDKNINKSMRKVIRDINKETKELK